MLTTHESFAATIMFAVLAIVLLAVAAIMLHNDAALIAALATACLTYLTQSAATMALSHGEIAEIMTGGPDLDAQMKRTAWWHRAATVLWIASMLSGVGTLALLAIGAVL